MARTQAKYGFSLGDRVIFTEEKDPDGAVYCGQVGVVCDLDRRYGRHDVGVAWEKSSNIYHDCNSHCDRGHGRYVPHNQIALLSLDLGALEMSDEDFDFLLGINT